MEIVRNADGTLVVPVQAQRHHESADGSEAPATGADDGTTEADADAGTRLLHPGEGGYDEALSQWDFRHVLVGGVHSVEDFAAAVAEAEGGDPLPAHKATKIIGGVLAELE